MILKVKIVLCVVLSVLAGQCRADDKENKQNLLPDKATCGKQIATGTGKHAELGEFPWLAMLRYTKDGKDRGYRCLGSLINDRYILTTATCVEPVEVILDGVRLGEHTLGTEKDCEDEKQEKCSDPVQEFGVEKKISHSLYNKTAHDNDIALIRLDKKVTFTDYIRPICLPTSDSEPPKADDVVTASGWGRSIMGDLVKTKKRVVSNVITKEECMEAYEKAGGKITENHLCTKALRNNTDFTCAGDSGGPLMIVSGDQWQQVGIVSFGIGCGYSLPDGNMKVQNYLTWILENILP